MTDLKFTEPITYTCSGCDKKVTTKSLPKDYQVYCANTRQKEQILLEI